MFQPSMQYMPWPPGRAGIWCEIYNIYSEMLIILNRHNFLIFIGYSLTILFSFKTQRKKYQTTKDTFILLLEKIVQMTDSEMSVVTRVYGNTSHSLKYSVLCLNCHRFACRDPRQWKLPLTCILSSCDVFSGCCSAYSMIM